MDSPLHAHCERAIGRLRALGQMDATVESRLCKLAIASDFALATLLRQPELLPALLHDSDKPRTPPDLAIDNRSDWGTQLRRYRAAGIDPLAEPILTYPVLHYQNGGLVIDEHGETTVEGLFACGEIAGGTHGRNRMMGNSLLECCVFGRRAGRAAAAKAAA